MQFNEKNSWFLLTLMIASTITGLVVIGYCVAEMIVVSGW